ncbi:MAG: DUF452 family protein [Marinifilaceae bacterium]
MQTHWLHKNNSGKCILFMSGWGCDYHPFSGLEAAEYDVLMCYDYRDLMPPVELKALHTEYSEIHLVSWSLGVWVSNRILHQWKDLFGERIAINGTLKPISSSEGIPPAIFQGTIDQLNEKGRQKFFMRMCGDRSNFQNFQENTPQRALEEQKEELIQLQKAILNHEMDWNLFEKCLIGTEDRIFPANNMEAAWKDYVISKKEDWPHYCFNQWKSWDDLISYFQKI